MRYVRRAESDCWHWMRTCSNYPKAPTKVVAEDTSGVPSTHELCNQCIAKAKKAGTWT